MHEIGIACESCQREYPILCGLSRCESCESSLEVFYDYSKLRKSLSLSKLRRRPFNHSRYLELFPARKLISLGEGGTPLLRSRNLEQELNLPFELWFKVESVNPTGSFKDRGSSVEVAKAQECRCPRLAVASTGNMGASLAAYAAAAGMVCHVFTPSNARAVKLRQILSYGARVTQVSGDYTKAASVVEKLCQVGRYRLAGDYLFRREGTKSLGFELADQLPEIDHVFSPVGNGTLISSTWKAFQEWKTLGFSRTLPKLVGVQAKGCSPITQALSKGRPVRPVRGKTIAMAIECGDPLDGPRALKAVKESRGYGESVTDKEILKARSLLSRKEGLFVEPAGAASLAGLIKSRKRLRRARKVVCLLTGHGLKAPHTPIEGRIEKLRK